MKIWPKVKKALSSVPGSRGWPWIVSEPFTGAWQRNIKWERQDVLSYSAVFACITLIASDICKLRIKLVRDDNGIWTEVPVTNSYSKYNVINRPNSYQNRIQFIESWVLSKVIRGNAYIYKERNTRGDVIGLHVLHPDRVLPLISDDGTGQVFYQLSADNLSGIQEMSITVPAREIIHDRYNCFYHPLVGLSPILASGLPAYAGLKMMESNTKHFQNGARPSGILTIPEAISAERARDLAAAWETQYGGENYGKVAVLGGDLKYQAVAMTAEESQLAELLGMTDIRICSTFHVPPYKIGIGDMPSYNNVEALNQEYYNQGLQLLIESIEMCLDQGLDMPAGVGTEFDLDGLLRMDTKTQLETLKEGVGSSILAPNEARRQLGMKPVKGGESPMIQQQNYSLEAISRRDAQDDPFAKGEAVVSTPETNVADEENKGFDRLALLAEFSKSLQ